MNVTHLSCLTRYVWNAGFPTAYLCFHLSRDARPLIMQHFVVCTLLMGCQGSAQECHCAVYHYVVSVESGGIDVQVSFPAHLRPALLLLKPMANSPLLLPFLTPCSMKMWLRGALSAPGHYHSLEDGIQPFHVMAIWFLEQGMDTTYPAHVHLPPGHSSMSKGVPWCFRWAQKGDAAMSCRYLW